MFKEQKGITLVALVITIIVLLILAGVSISLVVNEGGVLNKAQGAVKSTEEATVSQEIQLSVAEAQMAYMDAWTKDQSVDRMTYYKDIKYYTNNCASVNKAAGSLKVEEYPEETVDGVKRGGTNWIKVTYLSNSNVTYTATFDVTQLSTTFEITHEVKSTTPPAGGNTI